MKKAMVVVGVCVLGIVLLIGLLWSSKQGGETEPVLTEIPKKFATSLCFAAVTIVPASWRVRLLAKFSKVCKRDLDVFQSLENSPLQPLL